MTDTSTQVPPWKPGNPVIITGLGLQLRSLSPADIDETFISRLRNPEVLAHLAIGRNPDAITHENLQEFLATFDNRRSFILGIHPADRPGRLGICWAVTDTAGAAVLTLAITSRDQWGKGAGSAAVYILRVFLFDVVGVHKMVARAYGMNVDVIRRLEQYGWVREGVLREAEPDGKGGWRDIVLFGLLRSEHAAGPVPPAFSPSNDG